MVLFPVAWEQLAFGDSVDTDPPSTPSNLVIDPVDDSTEIHL
jgi:hypothetical protein